MTRTILMVGLALCAALGGFAILGRATPAVASPVVQPAGDIDVPDVLVLDKKPAKCKSSNISCRPSVHHGTGCDGGGCDCKKGEICVDNPKASPGSPFSGKCVCG